MLRIIIKIFLLKFLKVLSCTSEIEISSSQIIEDIGKIYQELEDIDNKYETYLYASLTLHPMIKYVDRIKMIPNIKNLKSYNIIEMQYDSNEIKNFEELINNDFINFQRVNYYHNDNDPFSISFLETIRKFLKNRLTNINKTFFINYIESYRISIDFRRILHAYGLNLQDNLSFFIGHTSIHNYKFYSNEMLKEKVLSFEIKLLSLNNSLTNYEIQNYEDRLKELSN